jgi:multiple sugar transport system substrate-binding protein
MKKTMFITITFFALIGMMLAACQPTTVIETVEVPVEVEKEVIVTQEVEKEVVVTQEVTVVETVEVAPGPQLEGTIRVGSWESGDALEPWNDAIAMFEQEFPDVEVQLEAVPQEYGTKLLAQFAAGTAPDVFMVGDGDVAKFVSQGVVEPLDPYISSEYGLDIDEFFPAIAEFGQIEGDTYLMSKDYSPLVLYYNKDHFREADLDFPAADWTWDDLLDAALALTLDANGNDATSANFDPENIQRWGIIIPAHWGDPLWLRGILPLIFQNGGTTLSPDGTTTDGYLNSEATVEALQWYVDLFKVHHVAPTREDIDAYAGADWFQSELASMVWTGRWPLKDYQGNPNLNFGTMGLPAGPEGKANALCWAGFALYSESENKDAAWAFLKHIAAGEGAEEFAKYGFTAVKEIAELQGLDTDPYNAPIVEDLANVMQLPEFSTQYYGECIEGKFREELEKVFLEDLDVQTAMDNAAANADACLAEKASE